MIWFMSFSSVWAGPAMDFLNPVIHVPWYARPKIASVRRRTERPGGIHAWWGLAQSVPQALFDETAEGLHGEGAARASDGEDKKARPARGPGSVSALRAAGLRDDDLDTTVLLTARSGIVLGDRIVLAPANCLEAVCVYTLADQVLHHRIGPAL